MPHSCCDPGNWLFLPLLPTKWPAHLPSTEPTTERRLERYGTAVAETPLSIAIASAGGPQGDLPRARDSGPLRAEAFVRSWAERHRPVLSDLIAGLDAGAVVLRVPEEAHIYAHGHAGGEDMVAVRAEEGLLRLV